MRLCILIAGRRVFGTMKPDLYSVPDWNERAEEINNAVRNAVLYWNIAGSLLGGQLAAAPRVSRTR